MIKKPKFEIFKDVVGLFRFRLIAPNGEVILQSEGYTRKQGAKDTIKALRQYVPVARVIDSTK